MTSPLFLLFRPSLAAVVGMAWLSAPPLAFAQDASSKAPAGLADSPSPYYLGASQALTYDSNAFHRPPAPGESSEPSDSYSSTSLLAGFSQPISRQRVFGTASLSLNRYLHHSELNNTSYDLLSGLDWATAQKLSGNLTATLDQQRVAPAAIDPGMGNNRNLQKRKGVFGSAQWGGDGQLSLLARLGYSTQDYSGGSGFASDSRYEYGSLGAFYRPGSLLRLGIAARFDRTRSTYSAADLLDSDLRGRHLDFLADYNNGSSLTASGRLSYTRETDRNLSAANFSGLTGNIDLGYRATGKISLNLGAARDVGFNASPTTFTGNAAVPPNVSAPPGSGAATLYENDQVTDSLYAGATYEATAKIRVAGNAHYARARIITSVGAVNSSLTESIVDETRGARLVVDYLYSRALTFSCSLSRDRRVVSGGVSYAYTDDAAACSAQFLLR